LELKNINIAPIIDIFRRAVESAVVAKCSLYCRSVARNVTINIRSRYQNVTAVSGAVSNISSLLQTQARNFVILLWGLGVYNLGDYYRLLIGIKIL